MVVPVMYEMIEFDDLAEPLRSNADGSQEQSIEILDRDACLIDQVVDPEISIMFHDLGNGILYVFKLIRGKVRMRQQFHQGGLEVHECFLWVFRNTIVKPSRPGDPADGQDPVIEKIGREVEQGSEGMRIEPYSINDGIILQFQGIAMQGLPRKKGGRFV